MEKKALIPLAHGSEEMEAVIVIDMLRRAGINVKVAGESGIITCSRGVKILPDILLEDIDPGTEFHAIILPGGAAGTENLMNNQSLENILKEHSKRGGLIAAICAAPTILARMKFLSQNSTITSHPSVKKELSRYNYLEEKVVESENIITSRGAGTAVEFALKIIERLIGIETANKIANDIVFK